MRFSRMRFGLPSLLAASTILAGGVLAASLSFTPVPFANPKSAGLTTPNILPPELTETPVAQGSFRVENPVAAVSPIPTGCPNAGGTALPVSFYGYAGTAPLLPALGSNVEASKTEPDENIYLVLRNQDGPDSQYNYGKHFLFQGHEVARGTITRINLDADGPHRVTVLASSLSNGCPVPTIDGSGWDPIAHRLLFTSESTGNQSIVQATTDYPSRVDDLTSQVGHGGYEGVVPDKYGRIILVEDIGGNTGSNLLGTVTDGSGSVVPAPPVDLSHTKQPNSFIYRFAPALPGDLTSGGMLQVLQVESLSSPGTPITFTMPASATQHDKQVAANHDLLSPNLSDLHTYGETFKTKWITIHTTDAATCPLGPTSCPSWNANTLAKSMGGTPFKRPENGRFRPGTGFSEFYFDETGDTDATTAGAPYGGFGAIYKLLPDEGKLTLLYNAPDAVHAAFDNVTFWDKDHLVVVEDAGDALHTQRNGLDSAWVFDVTVNYGDASHPQPVRLEAEGRDPSATIDSGLLGTTGFQNEGDNEITGFIVSNGDGDGDRDDILGTQIPTPFRNGWRIFYTQQHGDNVTWEILPADRDDSVRDRDDHRKNDHDDDDRGHW